MSAEGPDVIVIGAGLAGLCCAGELVLQGARPLLIAEARDVGASIRPKMVEGNRGIIQVPTWQSAWGGGWWPQLVRKLNIPVTVPRGFGPLDFVPALAGASHAEEMALPLCSLSGASLAEALVQLFPMLEDCKDEFNRVMHEALQIPYLDLVGMHQLRFSEWLEEQKTNDIVSYFMMALASMVIGGTKEFCHEEASVAGVLGLLRSSFCGEASFGFVYPDAREGLAIPLAKEIERRGGTVWRGQKVSRVHTGSGRVGTVVMEDGREVSAPIVAFACGTLRIAALLDHVPPEITSVLTYSEKLVHHDVSIFCVLDKPVVPRESSHWVGAITPEGSLSHWIAPLHNLAPWTTQPNKQFVNCGMVVQPEQLQEAGGKEAIVAQLHDALEAYYPGYKDAVGAVETFGHNPSNHWYGSCTVGPKLPRTIESVEGLWFVNEGSRPSCGVWMEAAASAGILGARAMGEARRK